MKIGRLCVQTNLSVVAVIYTIIHDSVYMCHRGSTMVVLCCVFCVNKRVIHGWSASYWACFVEDKSVVSRYLGTIDG